MSAGTHTPKPWHFERNVADSDWLICCEITDRNRGYIGKGAATNMDDEANVRLIAAAPELLEACKRMMPMLERSELRIVSVPGNPTCIDLAREAIAKAEGRAE